MFRYFVLLVFAIHFADILTTKDYSHALCDSDYEIRKQLAEGSFSKAKKERGCEEKSVVVRFWRAKEKFEVVNRKLYFGEREV